MAHTPAEGWRAFRQQQWMAYVRRHPEAAGQPKQYFNIQENEYLQCLNDWETENAGQSLAAACRWLERCGAVRITPLAS